MFSMTLNQGIFLRIFPGYGLMGLRKKQGCRKIERTGSKRPIQAGLVGNGATDFLAPWMIWGFTATFPSSVTEETKGIADKACNYWAGDGRIRHVGKFWCVEDCSVPAVLVML